MSAERPRRSVLYLPASNARAIEKARTLACDVVVLDLEDAVGPDDKVAARDAAVAAVAAGGFGPRELVVRANGLDTPWGADDLAALAAARPDAVLVPKVASVEDLAAYAAALGDVRVWAMIETCQAILSIDALGKASAANRVDAWILGANDLAKEMRCALTPTREPLWAALSLSVTAARANGVAVLDAVFNEIADADGLAAQCRQGAAFGFDGKTLIHPSQVPVANAAFSPAPADVEWARIIVSAFDSPENAGKGVLKIDGRMVELLHLHQARRLLTVAEAIAAKDG